MCFADNELAAEIDLTALAEEDLLKVLFAENVAVVLQADQSIEDDLKAQGVRYAKIGTVTQGEELILTHQGQTYRFNIAECRDVWYLTSYLLDKQQTANDKATERYQNYSEQPLQYTFPAHFTGEKPVRPQGKRPVAAVIREKGSNSEREMANALYLAGFDVKDVHTTDLTSGRETLEEVQFIGAVGGFSNSDVLGSAKGWAGALLYNEKAKKALDNFFARPDTLSVGICNGCQLFMELELINPEHSEHGKMKHNDSHKHETGFVSVTIPENNSVMLSTLAGTTLGVWISHGEGKFYLPMEEKDYNIVGKYTYEGYPANPNGSDYQAAMLCDKTGRHLVTMPHIERSVFPWQWPYYVGLRGAVTPWLEAFVNARKWIEAQNAQQQ
jgi:AIR synthase related protein, C-domain